MLTYWLLTNTCYGTWLPGDKRGFVGNVKEHRVEDSADNPRIMHNQQQTHYDANLPGLQQAAAERLTNPPVYLSQLQATQLLAQFVETASHRGWQLRAVAIMSNHFHIVVGADAEINPSKLLGDFKSWGSRKLNESLADSTSQKWWTQSGSKRVLPNERAVTAAIEYVAHKQANPLSTWSIAR